jgi:hypothetical protein
MIAVIRDKVRYFDENGNMAARRNMVNWSATAQLHVAFAKLTLTGEQDVDRYVDALKAALLAAVKAGKQVQLG